MDRVRQIKASAGSGKTHELTGAFLRLMAGATDASWFRPPMGCRVPVDGNYGWQELLAVTFTNKAAAEMRERILTRLKDCALDLKRLDGWTPLQAKQAVDAILRDYGALNIRTIDSLLHLFVRLSALDFDLDPDFEPYFDLKELTDPVFDLMAEDAGNGDRILEEFFRRTCEFLMKAGENGFLAREKMRSRVTRLVSLMLREGFKLGDIASPDEIERHSTESLKKLRDTASALNDALEVEELEGQKNFVNALEKRILCERMEDLPNDSKLLKKSSLDEALTKDFRGRASKEANTLYSALCRINSEMYVLKEAYDYMPYVELARALFERLENYERNNAVLATCQIPRIAVGAARENGGINALFCRMGSRVTHLLIDEFQDTSRDQWTAIQPLIVEALSRGGSFTFVGDVKQAIYGWRGGDASLFDEITRMPEVIRSGNGVKFDTLSCNWRSRERVVAWNNALFSPLGDLSLCRKLLEPLAGGDSELLDEQAERLRQAFSEAEQLTDHCAPGGSVHLHDLPPNLRGKASDEELSELLPDLVERLKTRYAWREICILVRSNEQAENTASWLMARHIPVISEGSLSLNSQPVIAQLVELLRFLACPEDDLAFWSVLQSRPLLPPHTPSGLEFPSPEDLNDWRVLHCESRGIARRFRLDFPEIWQEIFAPLYESGGLLTAYDTVVEVLSRWRVVERNPEAEGFIRRFLEILFNAEEKDMADLSAFLEFWDDKGYKEKAPLPENMDAVSIMTMHKAKGLQFNVVLLPWLFSSIKYNDEVVFWRHENIGMFAPLFEGMGRIFFRRRLEETREALHLVYVSMTRAISELHCFLPSPNDKKYDLPALFESLVSPLRSMLQEKGGEFWWGEIPDYALLSQEEVPPVMKEEEKEASGSAKDFDLFPTGKDAWRPMAWLPRLRIFHNRMEEWNFFAKQRGTLIHHCLAYLQISGQGADSAARDARQAALRGLSTFPLPIPDRDAVLKDVVECLAWYASLPETAHWLAFGNPEQVIMDEQGRSFRVDLLVDDGQGHIAVEYKSGTDGPLPSQDHVKQLSHYLALLSRASEMPVRGALVYLDRRERFFFVPGDVHATP